MDMVEKVARAICVAEGFDPDSNETSERPYWTTWEMHARAAIAAMREPNERMMDVYRRAFISEKRFDGAKVYGAMIDAALTSTEPQE